VSALPPALRPWASQLSLFQEDLALHLGPYVARLSAALGSLRPRGEADGGEPQGYDGLSRRGTYDRLLVSEWLWALEAPDELVRRAAFGELSFLKPAFRQPQGARRSVVLLDAGPDQLGAPRIAHLALLIVLARRAEAAGAAFAWATLQADPAQGPVSEVTPATLGTWLAARDLTPPTDARLTAWRKALSLDAKAEDAWLVGAPRLSRLPGAAGLSRIEVDEVLARGARQLTVEVHPTSRAERSVALDLPPPDTCVRLLRDPFQQARAAPRVAPLTKTPPLRTFSFSADGRRLLLFREDGSVAAMAVPHSIRATVPRARRVVPLPQHTVVGAGWRHTGGMLALSESKTEYVLHGQLRTSGDRSCGGHAFQPEAGMPLPTAVPGGPLPPGRLLSYEDSRGNERLLLGGLDQSLFLVEEERPSRRILMSWVVGNLLAAAEVNRKVVFVSRVRAETEGVPSEAWLGVVEQDHVRHAPLHVDGDAAYFGYQGAGAHPDAVLLALRREPGLWRLFSSGGTVDVRVPAGMRVVGTGVGGARASHEPGVLALDEDRRTFWHFSPKGQDKVMVAWDDVLYAEASHGLPVLGWLVKGGGLVLCNLHEGGILYQALPGADG
jgi:hypothetical protein